MTPDRCGFGKPLDQLPQVVRDFAAYLKGEMAYTANARTFVAFTDPRAAMRVCGCRWRRATPEEIEGVARLATRPGATVVPVKFVERCDEHGEMCRPFEQWEHEIMEAR